VKIAIEALTDWIEALLEASGLAVEDARLATDVFVRATLSGQGHHDVNYLPQRLALLSEGTMKPQAKFEKIGSGPAWESYDGGGAMGEVCVSKILQRAMELADICGTGFATVRHSNHFLAAAPYAQKAAERGYLAIVWSNTDPCMGDSEARQRVIGNNPYGYGLPLSDLNMVYDGCMAYASLGKLGEYVHEDLPVPGHWGRDSSGEWTEDPKAILEGGIPAPIAGHKGFSLAILHEALTAGLSGGEMFDEIVPVGGWGKHSQTILAIKVANFPGDGGFPKRMADGRDRMKARLGGLRFPGERSHGCAQAYMGDGFDMTASTYEKLASWSKRLGVPLRGS
jgi:LDH2 family malate/lactate/ureidoglycolate dehydrogenase